MADRNDVHWTAKLPLLVLGLLAVVGGVVAVCWRKSRTATIVGLILIALGAAFIGYSMTIKEWCVVNQQSAFSSGFSPTLRGCLRMKGWTEL